MRTRLFFLGALAAVCLMFAHCESPGTDTENPGGDDPGTVSVTGVEVTPATLTLDIGQKQILSAEVLPEDADDTTVTWSSDKPIIATVDAQTGEVTAVAEGTANITATTTDGGKTDDCVVTVNAESVLINGVRWATRNVAAPGTFADRPEDFGMYYQWGKNVGWSSTDPIVSSEGDTVWDNSYAFGTVWVSLFDPCPDGWRVSTLAEFEALNDGDKVVNVWKEQNGIAGRQFVDAITEETFFLPAAGCRNDYSGTLGNQGSTGFYWSSTSFGEALGYSLRFGNTGIDPVYNYNRSYGFSVRCVLK